MRRLFTAAVRVLALGLVVAVLLTRWSGRSPATSDASNVERFEVETLGELATRLAGCDASICPHLVYVWSSSMPLSRLGIEEIALAADTMEVPLSVLSAEVLRGPPPSGIGQTSVSGVKLDALQADLITAGATVHFPSVVLFEGVEARGNAIVGHKRAQGFRALLESRIAGLSDESAVEAAPIGVLSGELDSAAPREADRDGQPEIRILWRRPMVPPPGAFFRRVPGTRFISYDQGGVVFLEHLEMEERLVGPGFVDFVPTPDGALFVTPGPKSAGLEFYEASVVFERGRVGDADGLLPVFTDSEMADQYPSVGILQTRRGDYTTYRILISWFEGLAFRDYQVVWEGDDLVVITPLTPKIAVCPGMALSTPILSKDGLEVAARDESTGTTKVFRLKEDGSCEEVLDIGIQTSKVGFSDDGDLIAFSSPDPGASGLSAQSTTYVLDRRWMQTVRVPESASRGLVIPEFVGSDSLLFLATDDSNRGTVEFRLVCCVR